MTRETHIKAAPVGGTNEIPYTPVEEALSLLFERRRDQGLLKQVTEALGGDIPPYLLEYGCFVLPRHIATPNIEALYVLEQAERYGAMAIFSQDLADKFTSVNNLKRRLARPEVYLPDGPGRCRYLKIDLVDIPSAEGQPLNKVRTRDGRDLSSVHNALFEKLAGAPFRIVSDSDWIDRNHRGNIERHYACYLTLFLAYGVLFEDYEAKADRWFKMQITVPLFRQLEHQFGVVPVVVRPSWATSCREDRHALSHQDGLSPF